MSEIPDAEVLDMLEEITQGYDDAWSWVNDDFIDSLNNQIEQGKELSEKQKAAIVNIYQSKQ